VHRVVGVHLVDQPQLDLVSDAELPVDRVVHRACLPIDEVPAHVRRRGDPVDVDHVVLPLDPAGRPVLLVAVARVFVRLAVLGVLRAMLGMVVVSVVAVTTVRTVCGCLRDDVGR
jgi:hypothetical protein